jgi:hypothetical protein
MHKADSTLSSVLSLASAQSVPLCCPNKFLGADIDDIWRPRVHWYKVFVCKYRLAKSKGEFAEITEEEGPGGTYRVSIGSYGS